jgi:hypothetical protein
MAKTRVSPFPQGSAERVLHDRFRRATAAAEAKFREAGLAMTEGRARHAEAEKYAEALRALGHGDKVPGQILLPNFAALGEHEIAEAAGFTGVET